MAACLFKTWMNLLAVKTGTHYMTKLLLGSLLNICNFAAPSKLVWSTPPNFLSKVLKFSKVILYFVPIWIRLRNTSRFDILTAMWMNIQVFRGITSRESSLCKNFNTRWNVRTEVIMVEFIHITCPVLSQDVIPLVVSNVSEEGEWAPF